MPLVLLRAGDVGVSGFETAAELNSNGDLKARLERLRLACGPAMGLGDVATKSYPKMTLVAPPRHGGAITTRSFIPHVCHDAIGVLAAVTVATACVLRGSITDGVAVLPDATPDGRRTLSVEHPSGGFEVA